MSLPLRTVAIADDEPAIVAVLKEVCIEFGYDVVGTATNGAEAVALVQQTHPQILLMDFHMPVLNGLEATTQIVAMGKTAVVLLTGDQDPQIARQAMDKGACGYMQKPFNGMQVGAIIESAWHRFQTVSELQEKNRILDEALESRKVIEKAKGILMEQQGFTEDQAH